MTQRNPKPDFKLTIELSPQLRKFMTTATEAGQIIIKFGKILTPLLLMGSIAVKHHTPNHPQLPPQPETIVVPDKQSK